ncbi:MAG TPA: hypothetical protein VHO70_00150 [Chitinispirillaceae bacterium]|nr:hypothetical protein [Chitinispirillaceae bacterium]
MARILITLVVLFRFTQSFAHDTPISTMVPYSSGVAHLNVGDDTVTFSNGLKIFSLVFKYPLQIPEEKTWNGGIACICTSGKVVYKSDPSMVTKWRGIQKVNFNNINEINHADWTQTTGNPDTLWRSATNTPLTTFPIVSLFLRVSNTEIAQMSAMCLYYSSEPCCDVVRTTETHLLPESNSIFYFLPSSPSNPNMKLQVVSVEIDSSSTEQHGESGIFRNYVVSGINIRWTIDSLGNCLFDNRVSIAKNSRTSICAGMKMNKYLKLSVSDQRNALCNRSDDNDHLGYFSLKEEKVTGNSGNGVFVRP